MEQDNLNAITIPEEYVGVKFYSVGELAKKYQLSIHSINSWIRRKLLDVVRIGHIKLVPESEIPTFMRLKEKRGDKS